jgi:hypothetical protein
MGDEKEKNLDPEETYSSIYSDNWEPEDTTKFDESEIETKPFDTDMITKSTQLECPKCGGKNYTKDGKCVRCDHHLI